eukprot:1194551-Prorocentrum_minimum.AAC.4
MAKYAAQAIRNLLSVEAEVWQVLHVDVFVTLFHGFAKLLLSYVSSHISHTPPTRLEAVSNVPGIRLPIFSRDIYLPCDRDVHQEAALAAKMLTNRNSKAVESLLRRSTSAPPACAAYIQV